MIKNARANAIEARDAGLIQVGKISWRGTWQPIPIFVLGEFHGQRKLAGRMGSQESDTTECTPVSD